MIRLTLLTFCFVTMSFGLFAQLVAEQLGRGVVAVHHEAHRVFVSWRLLQDDPAGVAFTVYRKAGKQWEKLTRQPLTGGTWFADTTANFAQAVTYRVVAVVNKKEQPDQNNTYTLPAHAPVQSYLSVPLQTPEGYTPNDASVGDLDGDGDYEIVLHQVGRGHDNSHKGVTDPPILQAYKLDGTLLWSINLGRNIREGAHYTQFIVYDLDGDGRAELACKTADGSVDGQGKVIGDAAADYRNENGYILAGPEFLTIFDGRTGAARATTAYLPARHPDTLTPSTEQLKAIWGDGYGNRCDRFLACVAYLDGQHPSLVMTRGYYTRSVLAAWDWREGKLTNRWVFDSDDSEQHRPFRGQGNHSISVADVDADGKDELIFGACVIDDNGEGLYSTGMGHGDALHVSDLIPSRPGLEIFDIQERFDDAGMSMRDARTGEILWKKASIKAGHDGEGPGRGNSFDIDPRYEGHENWVFGAGITGLYAANGELITTTTPRSCNFGIWWDGDLLRELLDKNRIMKWDWQAETLNPLLVADACTSNNGTKSTPALSADIMGDWREEVIWRTADNQSLRIYTTTIPTTQRLVTLMQDHAYRMAVVWQNVGYNQPPHTSYFIGAPVANKR